MKFQKFIKSIAADGIIYKCHDNGSSEWIASGNVFMRIPEKIGGVVARTITEMPTPIERMIDTDFSTEPCFLMRAIMPEPDSSIKDCIRVYSTENKQTQLSIAQSDYMLLDRGDIIEMYTEHDSEHGVSEGKALFVKKISGDDEPETIGIIFPTEY